MADPALGGAGLGEWACNSREITEAADYGLPSRRRRVYMIATRHKTAEVSRPTAEDTVAAADDGGNCACPGCSAVATLLALLEHMGKHLEASTPSSERGDPLGLAAGPRPPTPLSGECQSVRQAVDDQTKSAAPLSRAVREVQARRRLRTSSDISTGPHR
ncbi:DNA cytosine methyltransferase [Streptomyces sp. NPDC051219]|uniref:DNA cytosine methyltransferase n=1 Tax=Streptomyces sp. NPDC051219 TaxID=3155283 RepID=UPI003424ED82